MSVEHDLQPHLDTWHSFIKTMFIGAAGVVALLVLMALFLV